MKAYKSLTKFQSIVYECKQAALHPIHSIYIVLNPIHQGRHDHSSRAQSAFWSMKFLLFAPNPGTHPHTSSASPDIPSLSFLTWHVLLCFGSSVKLLHFMHKSRVGCFAKSRTQYNTTLYLANPIRKATPKVLCWVSWVLACLTRMQTYLDTYTYTHQSAYTLDLEEPDDGYNGIVAAAQPPKREILFYQFGWTQIQW